MLTIRVGGKVTPPLILRRDTGQRRGVRTVEDKKSSVVRTPELKPGTTLLPVFSQTDRCVCQQGGGRRGGGKNG